jgi:hypothetical protein
MGEEANLANGLGINKGSAESLRAGELAGLGRYPQARTRFAPLRGERSTDAHGA